MIFETLVYKCSRLRNIGHVGRVAYNAIYNMAGVTEVRKTETGTIHSLTVAGDGATMVVSAVFGRSSCGPTSYVTALVFCESGEVDSFKLTAVEAAELIDWRADADVLADFKRVLDVQRLISIASGAYYDNLEANNAITGLGVRRLFTGDGVAVYDHIDEIVANNAVPSFIAPRVHVMIDEKVVVQPINVFRAIRAAREAIDPANRVESFDEIVRTYGDAHYVDGQYLHMFRRGLEFVFIIVDHRPLLVNHCSGFSMDDEVVKGRIANFGTRYAKAVRKRGDALAALIGDGQ